MESGTVGASCKGVLIPVSESTDTFQKTILNALQSAHLYEESKQFFRYKSAVLVKNPALEEKYNAFRAKRKNAGYTEDELKESYGFLLFDDASKANALGETGVLAGNSTCTILGDPTKGIYISMYSDCLDQNRWYHGKSGYIAIIKLTKGKVKKVLENYTEKFTEPTVGFDCHVSEQLASVSAKTSSFLAFERTQYYIYELLDDGSNRTELSPAASCPFAVVSFSYTDTKATPFVQQEKSELGKQVCHHIPWRGKLQIGSKFYNVDLRSTARAFLPTTLPPVVKVDVASMSDVQRLLPRAVFETSFTDEAFFDNLYCTLCDLVLSEAEDSSSFDQLLLEIKERDLALTISLKEKGFLILLHSSHFLRYEDTEFTNAGLLQGVFVFPESLAIRPDTKPVVKGPAVSSEILQILPVLSYAESELEKTLMNQDQKLCDVLLEHMQSYATLINPGLATSPSRDVSMFPDQYDVAEAHRHIYSKPEWTCNAWQSLSSYMSKPETFQLPLATVLEILAARQADQREELDDDVYICLSSPEETQAHHLDLDVEDELPHQQSPVSIEKSLDIGVPNSETHLDVTTVPENFSPSDVAKDSKSYRSLIEQDQADSGISICPTLEDLPAELIVSITSAEQSVISPVPAANPNNFQFSGFSTGDSFPSVDEKSLSKETEKIKKVLDSSEVSQRVSVSANLTGKKQKQRRGFIKALENTSKPCNDAYSLPVGVTPMEVDGLNYRTDEHTKEMDHPPLRDSSKTNWRRFHKRKRIFGKLKRKKAILTTEQKIDSGKLALGRTILTESEAFSLKRKTERWDLKPIISICGRILVPHGSGQVDDLLKSFNVKPQIGEGKNCPENLLHGDSLKTLNPTEIEQDSDISSLTVEKTKATKSIFEENHHLSADSSLEQSHCEDLVALASNTSATSLENNDTNTLLQQTQEKKTELFSPTKMTTEGEVLDRLKTALSKRKAKTGHLETSEKMENSTQDIEPCVKKVKVQSEEAKCETASTQETKDNDAGVEKMLSVDPSFAFALGLTQKISPKEGLSKQDQEAQQIKGLNDDQERTSLGVTNTLPITLTRRHRIKRLKKHEGITAEHVKKKCTPLGVSTRVLQDQSKCADEDRTLPASAVPEHKASDYLHKHKQKFRNFRSVFIKEGSIQVTRQWQEHYDFNLDSKFTSDPKITVVTRALHGPWNSPFQDTSEEVRLIFHMWIGLFYSRTTARFFNVDSQFMPSCLESYSLKVANEISAPVNPETIITSSASFVNHHTSHSMEPRALNLSKDENAILKPEAEILDLSVRSSSAKSGFLKPQVQRNVNSFSNKKTGMSRKFKRSKSSVKLQESSISKVEKHHKHFTENASEIEKMDTPKDVCLDHTDVTFFESNGMPIVLQNDFGKTTEAFLEYRKVMDKGYEDGACVSNFERTQASEERLSKLEFFNSVPNKSGDIVETRDLLCLNDNDPKQLVIEKSCPMTTNVKPSLKAITEKCTSLDEEDTALKENYLKNDQWFSREGCVAALPKQKNDLNGHVDMKGEFQVQDHLKENGLDEKTSCISPVEVDQDLKDPKVLKICSPDPVKEDCIEKYKSQAQINEQLPLAVSPKEDCHALHNNQITLNDKSLISNSPSSTVSTVQQAFLEEACFALDGNCMKAPLLVSEERTNSFDESNIDLSDLQSKDCIEAGVQDKISDFSFDLGTSNQKDQERGSTDRIAENTTNHYDDKDSCETDISKETDLKEDKAPEVVDSKNSEDSLSFDIAEQHAQPQDEVQEACQGQEMMPHFTGNMNGTSVLLSEVHVKSQSCSLKRVTTQDTLMCEVNEPHKQKLSECAFGSRSSTPTVDEKPFEGIPNSTSSNSSVLSSRKSCQNTNQNFPRQSLAGVDEQPSEQKFKTDSICKNDLFSDISLRTMRVMQSMDQFLLESNPLNMPIHVETDGMNTSNEKLAFTCSTPNPFSGEKKKEMGQQLVVGSSVSKVQNFNQILVDKNLSSTAQNNNTCGLMMKKHSKRQMSSIPESKFGNVDEYKTSLDPDFHFHESVVSAKSLEKGFDSVEPTTSHFDHSYIQCREKMYFKNSLIPLSPSRQFLESSEVSTDFVESPRFLVQQLKETDDQTTKSRNEKDLTDKTQMCFKEDASSDGSQDPSASSSLVCTVFNTDRKKHSFLEHLSQRCLFEDLTQASMEQECLIFLEQMKNLLKKSKRTQICHKETHDRLRMPCTSPMTVKFSSLEDQEDSSDLLDTSLLGQKIKVDISKRKDLTEEKGNTLDTHNQSQVPRNPLNCTWVSNVTSECAKLYKARMNEVCSAKKRMSKSKTLRVQQSPSDTKQNEHFDVCDKMKKELSKTFQSNLNAVVKKSCKTKNRFFILITSDDHFFKETKAHLEMEGHIAVQPSKFFICEENSTSLLIILKNEDIAEHICKVPHLLKLKMSPDVQFTGIDEPDDVVNLTYQELFTRGGFILLNKSVLEPLSLCNMKKISQILQELSGMGKWKWILHYKDSRRLKENARLSKEANDMKKHLNWGLDAGILEVLPYHECDLMSKDQPDYLKCLLHLQVQNITYRYSVFITDAEDGAFEKNGILTMTLNTFLTKFSSDCL
ncbi:uncharacterized protein tasor2 isoform X2 [Oryzias melastigma]|uniref:uncharacterized protein tasor2 isoform X2 n=1 Tax=Oryzias melastigma TaxID=30732 RepID=UPI000CF83593|nr:uncharacterized protein tasor2 isoform X2 [Oryzias melastigma]